MIRQTINCDICAAEKQATSYWFVAYETGKEITLRGWETPRSSRKHAKHLCGQKCVQRMLSNFTEAVMANGHAEAGKEQAAEPITHTAPIAHTAPVSHSVPVAHAGPVSPVPVVKEIQEPEEAVLVQRAVHIDADLEAAIEAESWAGPAKPKENLWDLPRKLKMERANFLHAARPKAAGRLQKMA